MTTKWYIKYDNGDEWCTNRWSDVLQALYGAQHVEIYEVRA